MSYIRKCQVHCHNDEWGDVHGRHVGKSYRWWMRRRWSMRLTLIDETLLPNVRGNVAMWYTVCLDQSFRHSGTLSSHFATWYKRELLNVRHNLTVFIPKFYREFLLGWNVRSFIYILYFIIFLLILTNLKYRCTATNTID